MALPRANNPKGLRPLLRHVAWPDHIDPGRHAFDNRFVIVWYALLVATAADDTGQWTLRYHLRAPWGFDGRPNRDHTCRRRQRARSAIADAPLLQFVLVAIHTCPPPRHGPRTRLLYQIRNLVFRRIYSRRHPDVNPALCAASNTSEFIFRVAQRAAGVKHRRRGRLRSTAEDSVRPDPGR